MTVDLSHHAPFMSSEDSTFAASLRQAIEVFQSLIESEQAISQMARICLRSLQSGGKILACGNGGSACDALHLVGELMGRYQSDRSALPAVALNADPVLLTCVGNDYCFEDIFARQVKALAAPEDVLIVFSTSGNSPNVLRAVSMAREKGIQSIAFLGRDGGAVKPIADHAIVVSDTNTARIQEAHQFLLHSLMDIIERDFQDA